MKRLCSLVLAAVLCFSLAACKDKGETAYDLTEDTFFLVMTNMQYYPEQYLGAPMSLDCFTYALTDVDGNSHLCGVRKCSAGYGCTCGKDTIIGFLLESDEALPAPRNQSADNNDKTWVHLTGELKSADMTDITIHAYLPDGSVDPDKNETISFLTYKVATCELIEDASGLQYYVTK